VGWGYERDWSRLISASISFFDCCSVATSSVFPSFLNLTINESICAFCSKRTSTVSWFLRFSTSVSGAAFFLEDSPPWVLSRFWRRSIDDDEESEVGDAGGGELRSSFFLSAGATMEEDCLVIFCF